MNKNKKNYLGIDWGESKIGISFSDCETRMAFSYTILKNDKNITKNIAGIVRKKNIGAIIIGVPFYNFKNGKFGGEKLGKKIKKIFGDKVKIFYQNEIFSTKTAQKNLIEKNSKDIKNDDSEAARIILESWFESDKNNEKQTSS